MTDRSRAHPEPRRSNKTDEQLLAVIVDGETAAVEAAMTMLLGRYEQRILRKVQGKLPYSARAEEIAQDVLEAAVRAAMAGKPIGNFKAWIFRVANNKIAEFWRSPEGQQVKLERAGGGGDDDDPGTNDDADGVSTDDQDLFELEDVIESIMASLKESHRRIVDLYVFDDLSAAAVAAETGETANNVYKVAERFREELRRRLKNHGGTAS
jgi:RNA polymerase sigma-70 factor (ECF subfamily)